MSAQHQIESQPLTLHECATDAPAAPRWDVVWGPPVPYDAAFPDGRPAAPVTEYDEFFGPPVLKQGSGRWATRTEPSRNASEMFTPHLR
jgi:hypothetical protein